MSLMLARNIPRARWTQLFQVLHPGSIACALQRYASYGRRLLLVRRQTRLPRKALLSNHMDIRGIYGAVRMLPML